MLTGDFQPVLARQIDIDNQQIRAFLGQNLLSRFGPGAGRDTVAKSLKIPPSAVRVTGSSSITTIWAAITGIRLVPKFGPAQNG